jgi:hypothetical protein
VYLARASKLADDPQRDVFVVVTPGGEIPFDGPIGESTTKTARVTGVVIDAKTGEFMWGFMRSGSEP